MQEFEFSKHALDMLEERNIKEKWVEITLKNPEYVENQVDGSMHYVRSIEEFDRRYLRIVVDSAGSKKKIITLFFDRRLRRKM